MISSNPIKSNRKNTIKKIIVSELTYFNISNIDDSLFEGELISDEYEKKMIEQRNTILSQASENQRQLDSIHFRPKYNNNTLDNQFQLNDI